MHKILEKVEKAILLGNEAIVRGALEAGVNFATTYPGTPASEIGDTFAKVAKEAGIYFEYSTNEKVAFEAAAGAALSGLRAIVSFKHYGLNVASDSVLPLAYIGVNGALVIVVADDPNCWSSTQSEQDSRYYALLAHIPMLEPSDPQESKDYTKLAFEISEKFKLPVFLRTTTRVSHARGIVKFEKIPKDKRKGFFEKNLNKYYNLPPRIIKRHEELLEKIEKIREFSEKSKVNFIVFEKVKSSFGIIASGPSFNYVMDALDDLGFNLPVLKLGLIHPLPLKKIKDFIKKFRSVLVVEELEPILEEKIKSLAKEVNPTLRIFGKNVLPRAGEYNEELVIAAICKMTGKDGVERRLKRYLKKYKEIKIARRFPLMCPGCPHRATFYAAKKASPKDTIFAGDIGCYILGIFPPLRTVDFLFCMGASEGIVHGIKKATNQKIIAFIGDSTFFHAGIPGLINAVFNKSNPLIIIMDNRITAMTGHQPHPGVGITGMGEKTIEIKIEDIARACGVKNVKVVDPYNLKEMEETIKEFLEKESVSVIVAKRECRLLAVRKMRKVGIKIPVFEINQEKCTKCRKCLDEFACPAIYEDGGEIKINKNFCFGCGVCVQVCPSKAIHPVKK